MIEVTLVEETVFAVIFHCHVFWHPFFFWRKVRSQIFTCHEIQTFGFTLILFHKVQQWWKWSMKRSSILATQSHQLVTSQFVLPQCFWKMLLRTLTLFLAVLKGGWSRSACILGGETGPWFTLSGVIEHQLLLGVDTQDLIWICAWRVSAWAFRLRNSTWMKSVKVFLISTWKEKYRYTVCKLPLSKKNKINSLFIQ